MSRICFTASELVDGGGGQLLMSPSSRCTSSSSWSSPRRSVIPRLPVLRLFFYLLSVSFRVCPGTVVHRLQVPRKVSHVRVVRVWGSPLLLPIAHVSRTSVCLHHRQSHRLSSISGFSGTQISSVFRQRRPASPRSASSVKNPHGSYYRSHSQDPSSLLVNMYGINPHCKRPLCTVSCAVTVGARIMSNWSRVICSSPSSTGTSPASMPALSMQLFSRR